MTKFLTFQSTPDAGNNPPAQSYSQDYYNNLRESSLRALQTSVLGQAKPENNASSLPLYRGCSTNSNQLDRIPKNDYVVINAVGDQWCAVLYEGVVGYCEKDQLEFEIYE